MARHRQERPELSGADWRRFWDKVDRSGGLLACWPWKAARGTEGYGRFKLGGKLWSPHRIAAGSVSGGIPESASYHGYVVMHECDNPPCCNPAHLKISTISENVRDMDRKGRRPYTGKVTIPRETVELIRRSNESSRTLSQRIGISDGYIRQVRRGVARKASA